MKSLKTRVPGMRPVKKFNLGGMFGDPTKADTARIVNASQAQIQQLLDAGYSPYKSENLGFERNRSRKLIEADRGFFADDEIDIEDLFEATLKKPLLFTDIIRGGLTGGISSGKLSVPSGFFKDYFEKVDEIIADLTPRDGDASYHQYQRHRDGHTDWDWSDFDSAIEEIESEKNFILKALETGNTGSAVRAASDISWALRKASRTAAGIEEERASQRYVDEEANKRITQYRDDYDEYQTIRNEWKEKGKNLPIQEQRIKNDLADFAALEFASPGLVDPDEAYDLYMQGFNYPSRKGGFSTFDQLSASVMNATEKHKRIHNQQVRQRAQAKADSINAARRAAVTPGDLGATVDLVDPVIDPNDLYDVTTYNPDGQMTYVKNLYPTKKWEYGPWVYDRDFERESTDQREDLGGGFYLDRESAGTGQVTNEDLVKTLFHEEIEPNRKIQFYNKDLQDLVDVYLYDAKEMLEAAGIVDPIIPRDFTIDQSVMGGDEEVEVEVDDTVPTQTNRQQPEPEPEPVVPEYLDTIRSIPAKQLPINIQTELAEPVPLNIPTGRRTVKVGSLAPGKRMSRYGQKLEREYYYDPVARKYRERVVDEERKGGPVYGGSYQFSKGGRLVKRVRS